MTEPLKTNLRPSNSQLTPAIHQSDTVISIIMQDKKIYQLRARNGLKYSHTQKMTRNIEDDMQTRFDFG